MHTRWREGGHEGTHARGGVRAIWHEGDGGGEGDGEGDGDGRDTGVRWCEGDGHGQGEGEGQGGARVAAMAAASGVPTNTVPIASIG